jgi:TonB-linked SusC/RagA family outer membrane protein
VLATAALFVLAVGAGPLQAQIGGTISGTVTESGTERALDGARVVVVEANLETRTDAQGNFEIRNVPVGVYTVQALFIGYSRTGRSVTVTLGSVATVDFVLNRAPIQLDEVVVTGTAGRTEKREIGNAVTSLDVSDLTSEAPIANVQELLQGRSPGVTLYSNSGLAGTGNRLQIRGAGSLNAGYRPVFFIDGVRYESNNVALSGNSTVQSTSPLDFMDPNEIERIEVIKGPAASTLYGANAAGGVVQIITKKGQRGTNRVQWNASFEYGQSSWYVDNPTNFYQCNASRIRNSSGSYDGCENPDSVVWKNQDGEQVGIPEEDIIRFGTPDDSMFVVTDDPLNRHPSAIRTGNSYDFKLSARGGGQLFNYFLSVNSEDQEGIFFNNFADRKGGRANFGFTPSGTFNVNMNFSYTRGHIRMPLSDNASNGLLRNAFRGRARARTDSWESGFHGFGPDQSNEFNLQIREERTILGTTLNWDPFPWLENRLTLGLDKYDRRESNLFAIDSLCKWGSPECTGATYNEIKSYHTWTFDYAGSFRADISQDVSSRFSAGMQVISRTFRQFDSDGEGLVADSLNTVSAAAQTFGGEQFNEQTSLGFYVQEQIGFRNKLYVTGALRIDDNSAFGEDFSLVVYPKLSLSYVISEEGFFNVGFIDDMKLRAAWGQAGNAPAPFSADRTYGAEVTFLDGVSSNAVYPDEYGNPALKAETGQEIELGFDAALLRGAMSVEFTYYKQNTKDALMSVPDAPSTGWSGTHFINVGEIQNSGLELLWTWSPFRGRNFSYDLTFAFSTNHNKLISFGETRDEVQFGAFTNSQRHREGYPLGGFWSVDVLRNADGSPDTTGGDVTVDFACSWPDNVDPDGRDGPCHEQFEGPATPTREFAWANTFTFFNNLRLFFNFDYKGGHYQLCAICSIRNRVNQNTWEVANPEAPADEVMFWESRQTVTHISAADWLKLREVSLTYSIPSSWGGPFRVSRWSVTVSGRNLWTTTKYTGTGDPEVLWVRDNFETLDYASVPQPRRFSALVQINF